MQERIMPLGILAAAAMAEDFSKPTVLKVPSTLKSIMPKKDYNRRQVRTKMAKASRKANRFN